MKRRLSFFGFLVLVLCNIIGCNKNEPPTKVIDPETGIFNYIGTVSDSTQFPDTIKGPWVYPYTASSYQISNRNILSTIRITKVNDSILLLSRPKRDAIANYSGVLFTTDPNDISSLTGDYGDTLIISKYLSNAFIIPSQTANFTSIGGNINIYDGVGMFTNGQWELTYKTYGRIASYLDAYHTYHLICTK